MDETEGTAIEDSESRFTDRGINIWPTANASEELLDLLNPSPGTRSHLVGQRIVGGGVQAISDERSIVYMAKENLEKESAIVLVNFDPGVRFGGLTEMNSNAPLLETDGTARKIVLDQRGIAPRKRMNRAVPLSSKADTSGSLEDAGQTRLWFREEMAMHMNIGKGFQFTSR